MQSTLIAPVVPPFSMPESTAANDSTSRLSFWIVPIALALGSLLSMLLVDLRVASGVKAKWVPDGAEKLLEAAEHFGTFYGQILAFFLIISLDPKGRAFLPRLAGAAWGAGIAANLIKVFVGRTRPKYFDFDAADVGIGFLGLFPGFSQGSRVQGFPSGHTASAVGFAIALAHVYPRGRLAFYLFAALVGLQRIATSSHFASDVFAGALVGWIFGQLLTRPNRLTRRLDTLETASP